MSAFVLPELKVSSAGFGPPDEVEFFKDVPFAPFSKSERLGKIADWISSRTSFQTGRFNQPAAGASASPFAVDEDNDDEFQIVDSRPTASQKNRQYVNRWGRGGRRLTSSSTATRARAAQRQGVQRQRVTRPATTTSARRWNMESRQRNLEASVQIDHSWGDPIAILEFSRLSKLKDAKYTPGEVLYECGTLEYVNPVFSGATKERPLEKNWSNDRNFYKVTTSDDPIIRNFAEQGAANVFATDAILTYLMTAPRSVYSWDIVITKKGNQIFLDKRGNRLDMLSVNENSSEPPDMNMDDPNNLPNKLSQEATFINQNFSQQILLHDQKYEFENPNPFGENSASVGYRYMKFTLDEDHTLICRTEVDAAKQSKQGVVYACVKALNEYDPKVTGDWRKRLETQQGAVLATELKNNAVKLSRWIVGAIAAGASSIELGFVSRLRDAYTHSILSVQSYKPQELATQMGLNLDNMWSIVRHVIDLIEQQEDGKYLVLKDPSGANLKIYKLPDNAFVEEPGTTDGQLILK